MTGCLVDLLIIFFTICLVVGIVGKRKGISLSAMVSSMLRLVMVRSSIKIILNDYLTASFPGLRDIKYVSSIFKNINERFRFDVLLYFFFPRTKVLLFSVVLWLIHLLRELTFCLSVRKASNRFLYR